MTFANPSFLWAFTGLAIPLAIHLLSRKEGKVIRVGSIRHVEESNTSQFKSIRLNEIFLWLLRSLMISLIVLFMSGAQCSGPDSKSVKQLFVENGIDLAKVDSLVSGGYELHRIPDNTNYWTFAETLNRLPYDIVVVSFSKVSNFNGKRIALRDNIRWITAESTSKEFPALAWTTGDTVFVRTASSNAMLTSYKTGVGVPDSIQVIKPQTLNVSADDKMVIAALNVLRKEYKLPIQISNNQQPTTNIKITPNVGPLVERISPTEIHINKTLDQDVALNENLVIELFKVLYPDLQRSQEKKDTRVLPDEVAWSDVVASSPRHLVPSSGIEKYLIVLFVLALATERFVAIRRNQ